ncbi:MAG: phosphoribosylformylglycinamidine cyclo-ligase [Thermoguttaceae bacterium]|nr:phosphoribosylformylglycinamidine cyclo-ligase [Thermoguttaceae bacterium]MDW8078885.1 phosphoribosylformylglycinamidine cyclo-ligase [Thermoguttaceae bacterium]
MAKLTYKDAGVDLDIYNQAMERLPRLLARTFTPRVIPLPGGFAGLFQLDFDCPIFARRYRNPVLVACSDGVGTKLKVASMMGRHNTVGIDLVAMNVNDALCCGAEPLFFLDYVALPKDDPPLLEEILSGIATGCQMANCALIGGETAILPDTYQPGDYDLAGFCVAVVDRDELITGKTIVPGDLLVGLASSGLHSNGYSLARKVVFQHAGLKVNDYIPSLGQTVGEVLLRPTTIYVPAIRSVLRYYRVKTVVHGIAHVTGGGIFDNLRRILPPHVDAIVEPHSWPVPPVFRWLQSLGDIEEAEMFRVFNMGIGMILVVSAYYADSIRHQIEEFGIESWIIGRIAAGSGKVCWAGELSERR